MLPGVLSVPPVWRPALPTQYKYHRTISRDAGTDCRNPAIGEMTQLNPEQLLQTSTGQPGYTDPGRQMFITSVLIAEITR